MDTMPKKQLKNGGFDICLENDKDSVSIQVKDGSNKQSFVSFLSQEALQKANFNQPIENFVAMIVTANEAKCNDSDANLYLTIGYLNENTSLRRNGFNNQFVDKSQLNSKFCEGDALYLIVSLNQSFFKMDYPFKLDLQNRSENEILKEMITDLHQKCNDLQTKCENLEKEKKMMRQCINLNEGTISRLQKQIENMRNKMERTRDGIGYWSCKIYISQNEYQSDSQHNYNIKCGADILWPSNNNKNKNTNKDKANDNESFYFIKQSDKGNQFKIVSNGIYRISCTILSIDAGKYRSNKFNHKLNRNVDSFANSQGIGDMLRYQVPDHDTYKSMLPRKRLSSTFRVAVIINNLVAAQSRIEEQHVEYGYGKKGETTFVQHIQRMDENSIVAIRLLDLIWHNALDCVLCIEKLK